MLNNTRPDDRERYRAHCSEVSGHLNAVLSLLGDELSARGYRGDVEQVRDYLAVNELGLAMEALVETLSANSISIPAGVYEHIRRAGTAMGMEPSLWEGLRPSKH